MTDITFTFKSFRRAGFLKLIICLFLAATGMQQSALAQAPSQTSQAPVIHIDGVAVSPDFKQARAKGWAFHAPSGKGATDIAVSVGGVAADKVQWEKDRRPDVAKHWNSPNNDLGFSVQAEWTNGMPAGPQQLIIQAVVDGKVAGAALTINGGPGANARPPTTNAAPATAARAPTNDTARAPTNSAAPATKTAPVAQAAAAPNEKGSRYAIAIILILLAGITLCIVLNKSDRLRVIVDKISQYPKIPAFALTFVFLILVLGGVTGSSMQHLVGSTAAPSGPAILDRQSEVREVLFTPRGIRTDEWMVLTPNALAQVNHQPPFPIVNKNLGPDGQNMLIVGMTGVPVMHLSALAKPATWGYFFLPLKQALAFHWQLPIFGCLIALYCLLNLLAPATKARNLALSAMFCIAPYATGWSNWPLYVVGLASGALALTLFIIRPVGHGNSRADAVKIWLAAIPLACLAAGFALTLYPPWQIPIAIFSGLLLLGYGLSHRSELRLDKHSLGALALAAISTAVLLGAWWIDAKPAVEAIQATVYPGQRAELTGGKGFFGLLRGYANAETLSFKTPSNTNASESASYFFVLLPLLVLAFIRQYKPSPQRWIWRAWIAFVVVTLIYIIAGFPLWLSQALGLSWVPNTRLDLGLAWASIFAMALLPGLREDNTPLAKPLALAVTAASAALIATGLWGMPEIKAISIDPVLAVALLVSGILMIYWLLIGRIGSSIAITLLIYAVSVATFNPWAIAPERVSPSEPLKKLLSSPTSPESPSRVLVLGAGTLGPMALFAGGIPVVNGVHYYPQPSLWKGLGVSLQEADAANRYQHLSFIPTAPANGQVTAFESPQPDVVRVLVDPGRFSFASVGAGKVMATLPMAPALQANPRLRLRGQHRMWVVFDVLPDPPAQ